MRMTPSSPNSRAKGSRNPVHQLSRDCSPACTLAINQITAPAGAATAAARPSTKRVRSSTERTSTWPTRGLRKGGSSKVKDEGTPRSTVEDNSLEQPRVAATPSNNVPSNSAAP